MISKEELENNLYLGILNIEKEIDRQSTEFAESNPEKIAFNLKFDQKEKEYLKGIYTDVARINPKLINDIPADYTYFVVNSMRGISISEYSNYLIDIKTVLQQPNLEATKLRILLSKERESFIQKSRSKTR